MGTWAVACSPILLTTITVERLQKRGYESMLTYYLKIALFWCERLSPSVFTGGAVYSISISVFFFVRWFFGRRVGQPHSLPSLGFSVGLCGLAMCVAIERWHLSILVRLQNFLHNLFCSKQCRTNLRLVLRAY